MKDIGFPRAPFVGDRCGTRRGSTQVSDSSVATKKVSVEEIAPKKRTVRSLFRQQRRQRIPMELAVSLIRNIGVFRDRKEAEADSGTITGISPVPQKREIQAIGANA